jgi:stage II sporulation protein D
VRTDGGPVVLRGGQIRSALRAGGGEILNSTYFTVETAAVCADGQLARLTLRGSGNGHGVGMCQWGAVGRARAGSDYREILAAYYPGTTLGRAGGRGDAAAR